jgi:hypothetical protein
MCLLTRVVLEGKAARSPLVIFLRRVPEMAPIPSLMGHKMLCPDDL